ncbi:MAG: S41 family peptidase [Cyclobacteriaceae bacterium]|nr:S41 family peptidase [Cyclobacteriaceae bacterium]MCH8517470.1 S41 family peptidase [Cyclobacteriaceae bacterium]
MKISLLITFALVLTLTSCEKLLFEPEIENNNQAIFEEIWNEVDQKYSFFEFKGIDWDSVYSVYDRRVNNQLGTIEFFDLMAEMLFVLEDGHVNISAGFDRSRNWEWFLNDPPNANQNIIERNYLGRDYRQIGPFRMQVFEIAADQNVVYLQYTSFASVISDSIIDFIVRSFKDNTIGMIIDIRDNGGGRVNGSRTLASRFCVEPITVSQRVYKAGPGRNDFSDPHDFVLEPGGENQYTNPVVVLTNRRVYSAANDFVLNMQALPQVTVIGDRTGGGGGLPISSELPNGWVYRFSSTQSLRYRDGFNVEAGIDPDIKVDLLPEDEAQGVDTIIETAFVFLRNVGQ